MTGAAPATAGGRFAFPALILANLLLAFGPWLVREADTGPVAAGFWRLALALPFLALFAWRQHAKQAAGRPPPTWPIIFAVILAGFFFAVDLATWHESIIRTRLANATLFGNSASFLFALYGFILARRFPGRIQLIALLLAGAGTFLLLGESFGISPRQFGGDLLALAAGFFYACYLVAVDRARGTMDHWPVLAIATAAGAPVMLFIAWVMGETIIPGDWSAVLLLALTSQLFGQGLLVYAIGHISPVVVGIGLLTQPAVAATIGWLVFDERLSAGDVAGAILVCIALVLIRLPERRLATDPTGAH